MRLCHFSVELVDGRLYGKTCRCRLAWDHVDDGTPALFVEPQGTTRQPAEEAQR